MAAVTVLSGCSGAGGPGPGSSPGAEATTGPTAATAGPTAATAESRLLTVDDLPSDGWEAVPPPTAAPAADPVPSGAVDATAVCRGDFRSVLDLPPQTATASFRRGEVGFTEQIIPGDDPRGMIDDLRSAVTECGGAETPLPDQDATVSFEPLPDSMLTADRFGAVTRVTSASGVISLAFLVSDLGDAVAFTQLTAPLGSAVSGDELARLADRAVEVAALP